MTGASGVGHPSGLAFEPESERVSVRAGAVTEALSRLDGTALPRGAGMTYGDSNVNSGGALLESDRLDRFIEIDAEAGVATVESGVTLRRLLDTVRPLGWTVPACPGTARVTIGGMVAHDVHGKDHPRAGSFGGWVEALTLVRSDGARECSRERAPDLFRATIGGLGLTGFIERVRLRLAPFPGRALWFERARCRGVERALARLRGADAPDLGYVWVDGYALRPGEERCVVVRARCADRGESAAPRAGHAVEALLGLASRVAPSVALSAPAVRAANLAYRASARHGDSTRPPRVADVDDVLFPQDRARLSPRIHGRRGVLAHHSVVRTDTGLAGALERLARPGAAPPALVLKVFGEHAPAGLLSFGGPGVSIATGAADRGAPTRALLDDLDRIALDDGGQLYPAKDARMDRAAFARSFPRAEEFARHVDPLFESNFWRRVGPRAR